VAGPSSRTQFTFKKVTAYLQAERALPGSYADEILPVAFHPEFILGGGVALNDPIHYEKCSPLAVVNLLGVSSLSVCHKPKPKPTVLGNTTYAS
jgi:hypothetical protein